MEHWSAPQTTTREYSGKANVTLINVTADIHNAFQTDSLATNARHEITSPCVAL